MIGMSTAARALHQLIGDFKDYAPACLQVLSKAGKLIPFELNDAQLMLHDMAEEQLIDRGLVRIIVLKGRQQGISTYVGGRFYWKAATSMGKRFVILTHLMEATENLFNMVKRYHDNVPAAVKPKTKFDNAKELNFAQLNTKYNVATAGSRGTGRGGTAQFMHGSEVAFWANAPQHMAGIGQIVPFEPGTEIFLESTGNGVGNLFYTMVMNALKGKGDYRLCFIPWMVQKEYRRTVPPGTVFEPEELEYQEAYKVTDEQLMFRRLKVEDDFGGDTSLFDQEYPATVELAFMAGASKALIHPRAVAKAINTALKDNARDALMLGVDPAEYGDDDTALVLRRGHKVLWTKRWSKMGNAEVAGRISRILRKYEELDDAIDAVCIDVTGVGTGVESILSDQGETNIYRVHFGEKPYDEDKYSNRAAECYGLMRDWFTHKTKPVDIPNDQVLQAELGARKYSYDSRRRLRLQSKEDMRKEGLPSPNTADALALTFAETVPARKPKRGETLLDKLHRLQTRHDRGGSPGMAA